LSIGKNFPMNVIHCSYSWNQIKSEPFSVLFSYMCHYHPFMNYYSFNAFIYM